MDTQQPPGASPQGTGNDRQSDKDAPALNVERLADAVYRLMLADAKLERGRGGTRGPRG